LQSHKWFRVRPFVTFVPLGLLLFALHMAVWNPVPMFKVAEQANNWIIAVFGGIISYAVFGFVLTLIVLLLTPLASMRIGGPTAKRVVSPLSWFSITLCTTIAIGIIFWAVAEPLQHVANPGFTEIEPFTNEARTLALASVHMHWAFSPYAIYTVAGLAFAYCYHNLGAQLSTYGPLTFIFGNQIPVWLGSITDAVVLFSLVMGMSASLGAALLLIADGLNSLWGGMAEPSGGMILCIVLVIGGCILLSSLSGITRGIRYLSNLNIVLFIGFWLFVVIVVIDAAFLREAMSGLMLYLRDFPARSLGLGAAAPNSDWAADWTVFYYANWLAWAPVTAMFLAKISRGYTVKAFILVNLILPSIFTVIWMSTFGLFAISSDRETEGSLQDIMLENGVEGVTFAALKMLPIFEIVGPVVLIMAILSFITAADSNTDAIAELCSDGSGPETQQREGASKSLGGLKGLKVLWVSIIVSVSYIMISNAGIDGIRMLSNLGGLPALAVLFLLQAVLIKAGLGAIKKCI